MGAGAGKKFDLIMTLYSNGVVRSVNSICKAENYEMKKGNSISLRACCYPESGGGTFAVHFGMFTPQIINMNRTQHQLTIRASILREKF